MSKRDFWCVDPHHEEPCQVRDGCAGCYNDCSHFLFYGTEEEADTILASVRIEDVPSCAASMGCLCAGHARGNPASAACDTRELKRFVFECEFSAVAETAEEAWEKILEAEVQERAPEPTRTEEVDFDEVGEY